tara:strand:+ start:111 stop:221 length:111 start_codon:yes stop_codon:yes gene_type:complete
LVLINFKLKKNKVNMALSKAAMAAAVAKEEQKCMMD